MPKIITDVKKIDDILNRGTIVEILPSKKEFRNKLLSGEKLRFYIGFDPTSPDLHLSHAKNIILMEKFRRLGHEIIILFGDFTAMVGDPTGEVSARKQLSKKEISRNLKTWKKIINPLINFKDKNNPPKIMYNSKWLSKLKFGDLIGIASNFTVQQMIERDMFQKRLKSKKPIYMNEFLYPLMQGYDSVAMNVDVEVCGEDQIFNALIGRTLLKKIKGRNKFVVAVTLMENPKTGELMSKSRGVGIFLNCAPHDLYGRVMAVPDEMIKILFINNTYLSLKEIDNIIRTQNPRDSKMRLAFEITKIFHGEKSAQKAQKRFVNVIQKKQMPDNMPIYKISDLEPSIIDILLASGLSKSKSDAKRLISQKAVKINGNLAIKDERIKIPKNGIIVQKGPRHFAKIIRNK